MPRAEGEDCSASCCQTEKLGCQGQSIRKIIIPNCYLPLG